MRKATQFCLLLSMISISCDRQGGSSDASITQEPADTDTKQQSASVSKKAEGVSGFLREIKSKGVFETPLELDQRIKSDPENAALYLREYANALAAYNPQEAIDFLIRREFMMPAAEEVLHELTASLLTEKPDQLAEIIGRLHEAGDDRTYSRLIESTMNYKETPGQIGKLLGFLEKVSVPGGKEKGMGALAFQYREMNQESFSVLQEAFRNELTNPELQRYLPQMGEALAKNNPEVVKDFAEEMPGGEYFHDFTLRSISELGRSNPHVAAEWISEDPTLSAFFKPDSEAQKNIEESLAAGGPNAEYEQLMLEESRIERFDEVVSGYVLALSDQYPEDALKSADVIFDPKTREKIETIIRKKIAAKEN